MLVTRPVSPTVSHVKGDTVTIEDDLADYYLRIGAARYAAPPPIPAMLGKDTSGNTVLVGPGGTEVTLRYSKILASSGVLVGIPSSGSVGANGALSGLTAFPVALGPCFLYFPAGAVYAGSVAGFYYTNLTSTTSGTVYDNRWIGGVPVFPATPTPIVAAGPGAYVQTINADIIAANAVIPGGTLGVNGELMVRPMIGANSTANNKAWAVKYAGLSIIGRTNTTQTMDNTPVIMKNAGAVNQQVSTSYAGLSANSGALFTRLSVDSSLDQELVITLKITVGTDYIFLQGYTVLSFA